MGKTKPKTKKGPRSPARAIAFGSAEDLPGSLFARRGWNGSGGPQHCQRVPGAQTHADISS